jgi:CBS domain-containing protein
VSLRSFARDVVTSREDDLVVDAARKMRDAGVGCVVVVRGARPVGVLTDRDVAVRIVADGRDPLHTKVSEIVTYDPIVVDADSDLATASTLVRTHGVRRLPIVDSSGNLLGIVTVDELLVLVGRTLSNLCSGIEEGADASESR